ncbi:LPXTG-motif cell wall-anchored protein [Isoptericola jiangsuensis]|uniref:LPXTG-motif cell wall-anchored protein n=1 Tax=Isoptericola jiangsuensis TaxID=548579 RepID=A0A2A9EZA9_9MICO|nr:Ig-like domain-containing protein [Isoptericola jiangsuensis]PFG43555.1 LPXTG-motif cell wall-anchored protein [Isoptericola jiangsuensis]
MTPPSVRRPLAALLSTALVALGTAVAVPAVADAGDTAGPTVTVKPGAQGADGRYRSLSVKLQDPSKVDKVEINGTVKDLTDAVYSDVNGIKPGTFGAVEGKNVLVAHDVLGNTSTLEFVLDTTGPEVTVKPGSQGADGRYRSVSLKLHDGSKVDKVEINGTVKDLTDNVWSDVNGIKPGTFGAVEGKNVLVAHDVLGNTSTLEFVLDTTGPEVTVKPGSQGADGRYRSVSLKLHDPSKVDGLTLNGVDKDLTDNVWSDLNGVKPGAFGAVEGANTLVVRDTLGNTTTLELVLDTSGPQITVKPESQGADGRYRSLSVKLHDPSKVDKVEINGTVKDLTDNAWSDVNGIVPGTFGAVEGANTLVAFDVLGNTTGLEFVLDTTGPQVSTKDDTVGGDGHYRSVSFKLHDPSKVDGLTLNGVDKDLTDNVWSDLNGVKPGAFGAVEGTNTLVVRDVLGNTTTVEFVLDTVRPVVTIESPAAGATTPAAEVGDVVVTVTDDTLLRRVGANLYRDGAFYGPIGSTPAATALGGSTWTGTWSLPADLPAGTWTVRVGAFDLAGNWGGANVDVVVAEPAVTEPTVEPSEPAGGNEDVEPSLDGSTVGATSVDGVPWITYDVRLTDPAGKATGHTARLVLTDGTHTTTLELGDLVDGRLEGAVLWPGAQVAADGTPTAFPGWAFADGTWTRAEGEYSWTLGDVTATLVVNPELVVELAYPEGAGPQVTDGVETLEPVETDRTDTQAVAVPAAPTSATPAATTDAVAASTTAELALTGASTLWLALGAALLVAAGASVLVLRRRRA